MAVHCRKDAEAERISGCCDSQTVIRTALEDAALLPAAVCGLEMHGTGTPLGDPIEIGAAAEVLATARPGVKSCKKTDQISCRCCSHHHE